MQRPSAGISPHAHPAGVRGDSMTPDARTTPGAGIAMVCDGPGRLLRLEQRPVPVAGPGEVLIRVLACGVCRTDLHVLDGEVAANYPIVPGHEIVGQVMATGADVIGFAPGDRVGVPWLGGTCGTCFYCRSGQENLCDHPVFTGATRDGGYASHVVARAAFCFPLPARLGDAEAAPLLCAGLIGWRAYRLALEGLGGGARAIGLYGFGAAAHILAQLAVGEGKSVYAITRPGDECSQDFARSLGCCWTGSADDVPHHVLDAAILFAPVGSLVPKALQAVRKGGRVVCAGIHMSDIPGFPYADLWGERQILSVANLTREDGTQFLAHRCVQNLHPSVQCYPLTEANEAMAKLRAGEVEGALVLVP